MNISRRTCQLVHESLREDIGRGDMTTKLLVPNQLKGEAFIEAKANGIVCGGPVVKEVFRAVDPGLKVRQKISDGKSVSKAKQVFLVSGRVASILKAERVALNFLSHLSGIATMTHQYVNKVKGTRTGIYDTRKTTPLWRELEKYAVKTGGGKNHRFGLWDEVLVKDNHWVVIRRQGQVHKALQDLSLKLKTSKCPIEIEVASLRQLTELLRGKFLPDRILLDNFSVPALKRAVHMVRRFHINVGARHALPLLEASGGVTLKNVRQIAQTGVDRISIGALTHSVPALDFSLEVFAFR